MNKRTKILLAYIVPAIAACVVYANTLKAPFISDDEQCVEQNMLIRDAGNFVELWRTGFPPQLPLGLFRPVTSTTFMIDHMIGGLSAAQYHLSNLLLHALTTVLFVYFLSLLKYSTVAAFWGGLLFAVHPIHTEAVAWVVGRAEVLSGLFSLLSAVLWVKYRHLKKPIWIVLANVCYFLALGSKEIAVLLPAALYVGDLLGLYKREPLPGKKKQRSRKIQMSQNWISLALPYLTFGISVCIYLALRHNALGQLNSDRNLGAFVNVSFGVRLLTAIGVLGRYIWQSIFPVDLKAFYHAEKITTLLDFHVITGLLTIALLIYCVVKFRKTIPTVPFWIMWFFLVIFIVSNLVLEIGTAFAERFLYLPSAAFCGIAGFFIGHFTSDSSPALRKGVINVAALSLVLVFSYKTIDRNLDWGSPLRFWTRAAEQSPGSEKIYHGLAVEQWKEGGRTDNDALVEQSLQTLLTGVALKDGSIVKTSDHVTLLYRYSKYMKELGRGVEALPYSRKLTALLIRKPQLAVIAKHRENSFLLHADALTEKGEFDSALATLKHGLKLFPESGAMLVRLGNMYRKVGKVEKALTIYAKTIRLQPDYEWTYINLALTLADANRYVEAFEALGTGLEVGTSPNVFNAILYLIRNMRSEDYGELKQASINKFRGQLEARAAATGDTANSIFIGGWLRDLLGDAAGARSQYTKALKLDPNHAFSRAALRQAIKPKSSK